MRRPWKHRAESGLRLAARVSSLLLPIDRASRGFLGMAGPAISTLTRRKASHIYGSKCPPLRVISDDQFSFLKRIKAWVDQNSPLVLTQK